MAETPPAPEKTGTAHNRGPLTQDELDDLWLIHLAQARKDEDTLEAAMEVVRGVRKLRTRNRTACRTDGFPLAQLDEVLADEKLALSDVEEREGKRLHMRSVAGLPGGVGGQLSLFDDSFEEVERTHKRWKDHGFKTGAAGAIQDPKKYEVPADEIQNWMAAYSEGQMRLAKAWFTKSKLEGVDIPADIPKWEPEAEAPTPEGVAEDSPLNPGEAPHEPAPGPAA